MNSTIVLKRSTVNFVTTVKTPAFALAPISPRRDLLELVIRLLLWLLSLAIALRGSTQTACCDNPKVKDMGAGWKWCLSCGARWKVEPTSRQRLYAELDHSLKIGHNLDWMRRES